MPTAVNGERRFHASMTFWLGATQASNPYPVKSPGALGSAAAAVDEELDAFFHLWTVNRRVLLAPFHNMSLFSPFHDRSDVDDRSDIDHRSNLDHYDDRHARRDNHDNRLTVMGSAHGSRPAGSP